MSGPIFCFTSTGDTPNHFCLLTFYAAENPERSRFAVFCWCQPSFLVAFLVSDSAHSHRIGLHAWIDLDQHSLFLFLLSNFGLHHATGSYPRPLNFSNSLRRAAGASQIHRISPPHWGPVLY